MGKFFKIVMVAICAITFNSAMGAAIASAVDVSAVVGAVTANGVSVLAGGFMPQGSIYTGVFTEVWTGEMIKAFRTAAESLGWYDRIRSYNQYVNNDVIHFTELGGDPTVLVNNDTYPLAIETLEDADKPVSLDKFDTTATPVTDDELHACSYDKMASVHERHREALKEALRKKGIHAIAPKSNADTAPVITTTGEASADGTHKKMTFADLLALKRKFDAMGIPQNDRVLVMCSEHVNDLLESEQKFKDHYNINQTEGKIARLYGFDIYEYNGTPYYGANGQKLAWGALAGDGDKQSSVAFYAGRMMKAEGTVQFYHSEAKNDTLYHRNLVNFRMWGICLPLSEKNCTAAIVSASV